MKITGYFKGSRGKNNGYISPPLQMPRERDSGSTRWRLALLVFVLLILYLCGFNVPGYGRGNKKVVIILAANIGGGINSSFGIGLTIGVLNVKNSGDWAIEKWSIRNKKDYAARHGYELVVKDMSLKRKYAHEWRESWEKIDTIKDVMKQHPHAEWFWWLDLHTYIMEPARSLNDQIFSRLDEITYRNLSKTYNPLSIPNIPHVDFSQPMEILISQDCSGFNLGSFLIKRSEFTRRVLDMWWDPIFYEQKHMEWDHKEQDAFEHMYATQPSVRSGVGFLPQRKINSFPPGACEGFQGRDDIFYSENERDFLVNMAGCSWGRNCLEEMTHFKDLSDKLNRFRWRKPWTWV